MSEETNDSDNALQLAYTFAHQWQAINRTNRYCKSEPEYRQMFTHNVIIDEPGMGFCKPCTSIFEANREAAKLRAAGYNAIIKPIKPLEPKDTLGGKTITKKEALKGLGNPKDWKAFADKIYAEMKKRPHLTYQSVLELIQKNGNVYVAVFYVTGTMEWFRVDKEEYIRNLQGISNRSAVPFPCWVEVEKDGEIFIHPKIEGK